jgi:hypothetical protein
VVDQVVPLFPAFAVFHHGSSIVDLLRGRSELFLAFELVLVLVFGLVAVDLLLLHFDCSFEVFLVVLEDLVILCFVLLDGFENVYF